MKHTFSVLFYLKRNKTENRPLPIIARITINGEVSIINTQLKCCPEQWEPHHHKMVDGCRDSTFVNRTLEAIRAKINQIYYQQMLLDGNVTPQMIKEIYCGDAFKKYHLLSNFDLHNENFRKQVGKTRSQATYQKYMVTRRHLAEFLKVEKSLDDIPLYKINHQFICDFEVYLLTTAHCSHNSAAKFMQFFKRIIILAMNSNYIKTDPFQEYQIKLQQVKREYLTIEELKLMMQQEFSVKRLELVRDLFIFASFTGLAYVDLKNLKKEHVYTSVDGQQWLQFTRHKTKEISNVRLFDVPAKLIEKYKDSHKELLFPVPCNQKTNMYLKEIAGQCGINKRITFHVARHTCATTIALSNGLPMESVAKLLGHANIRTTQLYAKITDTKLSEDMDELGKKLEKIGL